jgi:chromosome segregation ATPase
MAPVRASDELAALHAELDSRLAALEAALADPHECALEPLILDLARTATQEAEANARRLSAQARAEADQQAGSALSQLQVAEAALASEREAGLELHRSLGAARSELEAAKQKVSKHTNDLDRMRSELSEAERCFAAADTLRQQAEEARSQEVARERATVQRLTDALAQARSEIDAARQDVASRAADMEAARERADIATRNHADLTQAVNEARARLEAIGQERDRLKTELEAARQNVATSAMALQSATVSAATERAATEQKWHDAEQKWHDAEARATAVTRERDGLIAERDAVAGQLEAARHGSTTAAAAAQAIETQRAALEQSLRAVEQSLGDVEARNQVLAREHDALVAERDAAQAKGKALVAELTAAQAKGDVLAAELTAAQAKGDVLVADLTAAQAKGDALVAERDAAQTRRDAAEAERRTALAQLEAARQGSTTATAAIQSLDAHRATIEQNWQSAEARADAMARERDEAIAQRDAAIGERATAVASAEALRKAVGDAQESDRARFSELRQRTERQIQDLEAQLLGGASIAAEEEGPEIDVSLDEAEEPEAIEIEPVVLTARSKAANPTSPAAQAAPPAGQRPTRVAGRHGFREPLEVKLDGETALLVDVSTSGAQVLSSIALKPNKLVKMLLPSSEAIILCKAKIIWARYEPPTPGKPVRYRAGMVFTQADPAALQMFITRHSGVKMTATPSEERKTGRLIPVPFSTAAAAAGQRTRRADSREPIASLDFNFPAQRRD